MDNGFVRQQICSASSVGGGGGLIFALDALRGIAIAIVIFGHALQKIHGMAPPHPLHAVILCFQMELFFVIAGYAASLSVGDSFKSGLAKRSKRLLLPYLVWVTISFIYGLFRGNSHFDIESLVRYYFMHSFWFLRTMFYVSCIHMSACWIFESMVKRVGRLISGALVISALMMLTMLGKYGLCDGLLPKYIMWFYVGFGISQFVQLKPSSANHSLVGKFITYLGKESLALYALHWWLFFKYIPIPLCPDKVPQVVYAFIIFMAWLIASIGLDKLLSKTPLSVYLLGKPYIVKRRHV